MRIAADKEGKENGQKTRDFVAQLLIDVLKLDGKPMIDQAHRALQECPADFIPPRHLILRIHYCHELEDIFQRVTKSKSLSYQGQRIQIFRDFLPADVKRHAAFTPAKNLLRNKPGVKFGLLYLAKLRVRPHSQTQRRCVNMRNATSAQANSSRGTQTLTSFRHDG